MMPQPMLQAIGRTSIERQPPCGPRRISVIGMQHVAPAVAVRGTDRHACKFVPASIVIVRRSARLRGPHHLRHGVGNQPKPGFGPRRGILCLHLQRDIDIYAEPVRHFALVVERGIDACQKGSIHPIRTPDGKHHFEALGGRNRFAPPLEHGRQISRIMHRLPAPPLHLGRSSTGVLVPERVVPTDIAGGIRDPTERRYVFGEAAEQFILHRRAEGIVIGSHLAGHLGFLCARAAA